MKQVKLTILATAATFVLGVHSTGAAIGTTTYCSKLAVAATVSTNSAGVSTGVSWKYPVKTVKFGNKQLLDLFAAWYGADRTVDPWKSAQLVVGWDWNNDVLVVDKTGTNVLMDANYNVDTYFIVDFFDYYGVGNSYGKTSHPGYWAVTDSDSADFELFDDLYPHYTDLWGDGGNKQVFKQSWDANGSYTTWSDSESATFPYNGNQYLFDWGSNATTTAKITAKGSGKGENWIGWAVH